MKENKTFKAFRSTLNESEYSEVLTGYGYRSAHKDGRGLHHLHSAGALAGINAMLATISRGTFLDPNEAFLKMKVRLNVVQLDFDWKPGSWDGGVGSYDIPVKQFGRVDGYDALTGQIRFDGKANPTGGYTELNLHVDVELTPESLYVVNAKITPAAPVAEETEAEGDPIEEMAQTPARQRDMEHKIQRAEDKASRGYSAKMTKTGKAAERGRKQEAKYDAVSRRLIARDTKEYDSPKLYGRGGKPVKVKEEAELDEMAQTAAREKQWSGQLGKIEKQLSKDSTPSLRRKHEKLFLKGMGERHSKKLYGKNGKPVKEEAEQIDEMLKAGDTVKVPHKGKMVRGKIVRQDSGGSGKAQQHGGGYVVDVGEYGSITVPAHKVVKEAAEQIDELSKKTKDAYVAKRGSQLSSMLSGHTRGKQLTGKQQANAVKGIKQAMGVKEAKTVSDTGVPAGAGKDEFKKAAEITKKAGYKVRLGKGVPAGKMTEALIGGQKKLDVNKNKRLDSQDFAMLRAKKKPVKEAADQLDEVSPPGMEKMTGSKKTKASFTKQYGKRGKSVMYATAWKIHNKKKAVEESADSVDEAVAKTKKPKKADPHVGAKGVIDRQQEIKKRLQKYDMRW